MEPIKTEGWLSPKIVLGLSTLLLYAGLASACLFIAGTDGKPLATFSQVASFMQILIAGVVIPLFIALGFDKLAQSKAETAEPLPSDGWHSRKILIGAPILFVSAIGAFICLLIEAPGLEKAVATFEQFSSFAQIVVPSVITPLFGALGLDQFAAAKLKLQQ